MSTLAHDDIRARIVSRLRMLRPDSPRRWGRMTSHQMVCHLADGCRMALGERRATGSTGPFHRTILKWIALYGPLRWPAGVPTSPELDQRCGGTAPSDFAADVATVEALLDAMVTRPAHFEWPAHPVFGPMARGDWLRWGYLHADHHLRQFGA